MLTKLGDLTLTIAEARALRRLIATYITDDDRAVQARMDAEERERAQESMARADRIYENLRRAAAETARQDGRTTIPPFLQARAAWEAFEASEGYLSRYDVEEHWEPDADDAETWELAYVDELERMKKATPDA